MSEASRACNPLYSMLPTDVDGFAASAVHHAFEVQLYLDGLNQDS